MSSPLVPFSGPSARVSIDVPVAEGLYGFGESRSVAVPIEVDPARVVGLRLAWNGHGSTGQARCDGLGEWGSLGGYLECRAAMWRRIDHACAVIASNRAGAAGTRPA